MFGDVGFLPVSCSVNYNDYNYVFILFCTVHEGRGPEVMEETGVWLPGIPVPEVPALVHPKVSAVPWASPLLQGGVHGAAWWGRDPWSLGKAVMGGEGSRMCTSVRRLYCVGFHAKSERVLGRLFSSTHALESGMSCSFLRPAVVNSQPQAWREEAGTRRDRARLLGVSGEGSLPAFPALGDSLPASLAWCSLKVPPSLCSPCPSARPLCLHMAACRGTAAHTGAQPPRLTPCGQITPADPVSTCSLPPPLPSCGHSSSSSLSFPVHTNLESEGQ